ncbi:hypothetical protein, partial [Aeromonas caviae]|uniref:hypothetical protein n=1 Tax=Aeromonas caviae TaxID=648 RepID=UPI00403A1F9C
DMAINIMEAFQQEPPQLDFIWPGFLAGTVGALVAPGAVLDDAAQVRLVHDVQALAHDRLKGQVLGDGFAG